MVYRSRELETKEIIYQNHIKHSSHLKVNLTLKEIKKSWYNWNNIEKNIRELNSSVVLVIQVSPNREKK